MTIITTPSYIFLDLHFVPSWNPTIYLSWCHVTLIIFCQVALIIFCQVALMIFCHTTNLNLLVSLHEEVVSISMLSIICCSLSLSLDLQKFPSYISYKKNWSYCIITLNTLSFVLFKMAYFFNLNIPEHLINILKVVIWFGSKISSGPFLILSGWSQVIIK